MVSTPSIEPSLPTERQWNSEYSLCIRAHAIASWQFTRKPGVTDTTVTSIMLKWLQHISTVSMVSVKCRHNGGSHPNHEPRMIRNVSQRRGMYLPCIHRTLV